MSMQRQEIAGQTLSEQLAGHLRRDILRGKLPPGASIKERDNASELGVSRTPMREAIRILAQQGLVTLRPSRSPIVAQPSFREVSEQVVVLIALEKLSAELACTAATPTELDEIAGIVATMADRFDDLDPLDMFEIDMSFHSAIVRAAHNATLAETHAAFLARLWRVRYLAAAQEQNRQDLVTDHRRIAEALAARDPDAAREAIHAHLWHLADDIRVAMNTEDTKMETAETAKGKTQ